MAEGSFTLSRGNGTRQVRRVNIERSSVGLAARLRSAGAPVQLEILEGVSHVTIVAALASPLRHLAPVREDVLRFVQG